MENHDLPSVVNVGMHRNWELVDKHFHLRGLSGDVLQYVATCEMSQLRILWCHCNL